MKALNWIVGSMSLALAFSMSCGGEENTGTTGAGGSAGTAGGAGSITGGTAGTTGGAAGTTGGAAGTTGGAAGTTGGAAGQGGVSQGGAAGQGGSGATSGTAGVAGTGGTAGSGGKAGSGGSAGTSGGAGYPPDATVVDTGVIIDGAKMDVVASDGSMGGCCRQIDLSLCRFKVGASYRTCWACDPGCYAALMPSTPVEPITKCTCANRPSGQRCIKIENRCNKVIRTRPPGSSGNTDLQPGACVTSFTGSGFRIEGTTGCETGTCDGAVPHTLVEMNLGAVDWYDLSHVDGANLPIGFYLVKGTFTMPATQNECSCLDRECRVDIKNTTCIERNKLRNSRGEVWTCQAECRVATGADRDLACCTNNASVPQNCPPTSAPVQKDYQMFRFPCPQAYSYPYDEMHEVDKNYVLCTCGGTPRPDYDAIFCP